MDESRRRTGRTTRMLTAAIQEAVIRKKNGDTEPVYVVAASRDHQLYLERMARTIAAGMGVDENDFCVRFTRVSHPSVILLELKILGTMGKPYFDHLVWEQVEALAGEEARRWG